MGRTPTDVGTLEALLKGPYATVMEGRPGTRRGAFKQEANQAGPTVFVAPNLVSAYWRGDSATVAAEKRRSSARCS